MPNNVPDIIFFIGVHILRTIQMEMEMEMDGDGMEMGSDLETRNYTYGVIKKKDHTWQVG